MILAATLAWMIWSMANVGFEKKYDSNILVLRRCGCYVRKITIKTGGVQAATLPIMPEEVADPK